MISRWYDAHIHFFYPHSNDEILSVLKRLASKGLGGFDALAFAEIPDTMETIFTMVPGAYHKNITPQVLKNQKDIFSVISVIQEASLLKIIAYADVRFVQRDPYEKVEEFKKRGFQGIKLLYVPKEEVELRIGGMEKAFGRSVKDSERITALLIEGASFHSMPILFHADLRKYGEFVEEMIRSHPKTNFNIPHFGSSRKLISRLMDRYANCYTDLSSLIPAMQKDPASYGAFMKEYQDRILFGSDGVIGRPEGIESAWEFVRRFFEDGSMLDKSVRRNFLRFHHLPEDEPSVSV